MDMTSAEFTLMYAFYSLPNIILPLIGGMYPINQNITSTEQMIYNILNNTDIFIDHNQNVQLQVI